MRERKILNQFLGGIINSVNPQPEQDLCFDFLPVQYTILTHQQSEHSWAIDFLLLKSTFFKDHYFYSPQYTLYSMITNMPLVKCTVYIPMDLVKLIELFSYEYHIVMYSVHHIVTIYTVLYTRYQILCTKLYYRYTINYVYCTNRY